MKRVVTALLRRPDADGALSLVGRTSAADQDATVEFLVAFTALEQYVKAHTASGTLVAKFAELASRSHAPTQVSADVNEFKALYRVRNRLAHEGQLPDGRDHGRRVRVLLARYLG